MARRDHALVAFNRGIVSKRAQARVDVARLAMSADQQTNWRPETLGPMALRVGTEYLLNSGSNYPRYLPFVFAEDDTALVEMTDGDVKIIVDDVYLTLSAVTAAVTNGDMEPDLTGWTDADDAGAVSEYDADGGALVAISNRVVYDIAPAGGTATAKYKVDADGNIYTQRLVLDGAAYQEVPGEWLFSGAAGDYEVRATLLIGSVSGSATGSWLNCGTDREWTKSVSSGTTERAQIFVELKLAADTAILASATITLKGTEQSSGGGGGGGGIEP